MVLDISILNWIGFDINPLKKGINKNFSWSWNFENQIVFRKKRNSFYLIWLTLSLIPLLIIDVDNVHPNNIRRIISGPTDWLMI